jgi:hypothetical protein
MITNKIYLTDKQNNSFAQHNGSPYFQSHQMKVRRENLNHPNRRIVRKTKEFSVMKAQNTNIDADIIDFYVHKAHTERSIAITSAFGDLAGMVKNIFTAPETGSMARGH